MKFTSLLLFAAAFVAAAFAADTRTTPQALPPLPPATVNVSSTVADLAAGYAGAAQQMSPQSLVIYYAGEKDVIALKGIRSVRHSAGVVIVVFSAGDIMALNAERIVLVTDGQRGP